MGTLTAGQPRLAEYCVHKLPTSCRLSSIPECCACADERSHAAAYSTYIDGVGYVLRGSRWQRYCWFCKEFWENRVRASGLQPSRTRIPEEPDQSAFLDRWYEFHQGYRTVRGEDGTEQRIAVVGEELKDVSPGCMPRTLEELREGREVSSFDGQVSQAQLSATHVAPGLSLDDELDQMFETAVAEQTEQQQQNTVSTYQSHIPTLPIRIPPRNVEYHTRRIAALRRELARLRGGIERVVTGLRELGEAVPDHRDATGRLETLGQTLDDISGAQGAREAQLAIQSMNEFTRATLGPRPESSLQERIDQARTALDEARRTHGQAATELQSAETEVQLASRHLQQLQREQRSTENMIRVFGTREDIVAQGDDYVSPIGGLFERAYERFRAAETTRREEAALRRSLEDDVGNRDHITARLADIHARDRDVWGVRSESSASDPSQGIHHQGTSNTTQLMEMARDEVFAGQQSQVSLDSASSLEDADGVLDFALAGAHAPAFQTALNRARSGRPYIPGVSNRNGMTDSYDSFTMAYTSPATDFQWLVTAVHRRGLSTAGTRSIGFDAEQARRIIEQDSTDGPPPHVGNSVLFESLLNDDDLVWTSGLPAERLRMGRNLQNPLLAFVPGGARDEREVRRQNIESMAEAYTLSAAVREQSTLGVSEQQEMLTRLQRDERCEQDRIILSTMLQNVHTYEIAHRMLLRHLLAVPDEGDVSQIATLTALRQDAARTNAVSRERLNQMRVQSQRLYGRIPHLRHNANLEIDEPDDTDTDTSDHDDAVGLDAPNSGRPDPKTDEEMTLKLECAICYSQIADIACLPCGHLTMCSFCSEEHSPTLRQDRTRPRQRANCPVCRKQIKQKVRVFRA